MDEDKTVNDGLEANENSYDEGTTLESDTEDAEANSETEQPSQSSDSEGSDSVTLSRQELAEREREIRKEQDRRWKERIKGLEGKEGSQDSSKEDNKAQESVASKEELDRFRLETKGIEDKAQQDFILKYAKLEDLSISEALNDDVVKAKLQKMNNQREKEGATLSPNNRTGKPREKSPEEMAREFETKGTMPKTPEQRKAVLQELQKKYGRT